MGLWGRSLCSMNTVIAIIGVHRAPFDGSSPYMAIGLAGLEGNVIVTNQPIKALADLELRLV